MDIPIEVQEFFEKSPLGLELLQQVQEQVARLEAQLVMLIGQVRALEQELRAHQVAPDPKPWQPDYYRNLTEQHLPKDTSHANDLYHYRDYLYRYRTD